MMTEGGLVTRRILLSDDSIEIIDEYELLKGWSPASANPFAPASPIAFSPAYGVRTR
jgi:hypothetical protein